MMAFFFLPIECSNIEKDFLGRFEMISAASFECGSLSTLLRRHSTAQFNLKYTEQQPLSQNTDYTRRVTDLKYTGWDLIHSREFNQICRRQPLRQLKSDLFFKFNLIARISI